MVGWQLQQKHGQPARRRAVPVCPQSHLGCLPLLRSLLHLSLGCKKLHLGSQH